MRKKTPPLKYITIAIAGIAIAAAVYFIASVFIARDKEVFVTPKTETPATDTPTNATSSPSPTTDTTPTDAIPSDTPPNTATATDVTADTPSNAYINVTPPDCARECEPYKYDEKELAYCKNVCGLSDDVATNNCDARSGLAKDYCLKDRAVADKNLTLCDSISDDGVKKTCVTRLQQEFIENM